MVGLKIMEVSVEAFKEAIKTKKFFPLRECSLCQFMMGFFPLMIDGEEKIVTDTGCDCVRYENVRPISDEDLEGYLEPRNGYVERIKEFVTSEEASQKPLLN